MLAKGTTSAHGNANIVAKDATTTMLWDYALSEKNRMLQLGFQHSEIMGDIPAPNSTLSVSLIVRTDRGWIVSASVVGRASDGTPIVSSN